MANKDFGRNQRIAQLIKHELAEHIRSDFNHSEFGLVTVSAVDVSPDIANAKVFVTALGDDSKRKELLAALNEQAGHYRHEVARIMASKRVPRIHFVYDESVERGSHMSSLIDSLKKD